MKRIYYLMIISMILPGLNGLLSAQESDWGIKWGGFVKTDAIYDTRQTVDVREGHFLLYPQNIDEDANGDDINEGGNFNMLSIQTRLKGSISAPDVLGAKTSGYVEGAFFGSTNGTPNAFRLRHAFVKLKWDKTMLLVGQYWHPLFIPENFPGVVSFNTGVPFQPFARNPQIRLAQNLGPFEMTLAAMSQRDFASTGPAGGGSQYLRNSGIPELFLGLKLNTDGFLLGAGGSYKFLKPSLTNGAGLKSDETIGSFIAEGYAKVTAGDLQVKAEAVYGQNMTHLTMLGGYGASSYDQTSGDIEYTNINGMTVWGDIIYGKELQFAVFAGYAMNNGADDNIVMVPTSDGMDYGIYTRGGNIENVMRIAPRIIWNIGKIRFAYELEMTTANYGTTNYDDKAKVEDAEAVTNIRNLIAAYIFF